MGSRRAASSSGSPVAAVALAGPATPGVPVVLGVPVVPARTEAAVTRSAAARSPRTPAARPPVLPAQAPQHPSAEGRPSRARRQNPFREGMEEHEA
ncbi:hypothetical protein [Kocuria turfanensis]|nr:hypothetical protein [Kocuria turfanensis]